jgi:hypothetical protein
MKFAIRLTFMLCALFSLFNGKAQSCGTCSINITSLDSTDYTVNSGQTFCIDTSGNFVGTLTLNGGTICNKGLFNPKTITLTSGSVTNYGNTSLNTSVTLGSGIQVTNNSDALMNINGNVTNSGGALTNSGIINVGQNIQNNSGSITNNSIINCYQITGSGTLTNNGKINTN